MSSSNCFDRLFVHSGIFHADDVLSAAIVSMVEPEIKIFRVRSLPEDFDSAGDIAADIGGIYDTSRLMFDHHQKGGSDDSRAAAGKLWEYFGPACCAGQGAGVDARVYRTLIGPVDRADIGVKDWMPVGQAEWMHLSASGLISSLNTDDVSSPEQDFAFALAVEVMRSVLRNHITQASKFTKMRNSVQSAQSAAAGKVIILKDPGPWQEHVLTCRPEVLFVIFPSDRGGYMLQCVPASLGSFETKKSLPKSWWGLRGVELSSATGLELTNGSAVFCHPGGFISGAETEADALSMAHLAVSY